MNVATCKKTETTFNLSDQFGMVYEKNYSKKFKILAN